MSPHSPDNKPSPAHPFSGVPEFAKAVRGLLRVSKKELDNAIARDKADKKKRKAK